MKTSDCQNYVLDENGNATHEFIKVYDCDPDDYDPENTCGNCTFSFCIEPSSNEGGLDFEFMNRKCMDDQRNDNKNGYWKEITR